MGPPSVDGRYWGEVRFICKCPEVSVSSMSSYSLTSHSYTPIVCSSAAPGGPPFNLPTITGMPGSLPLTLVGTCTDPLDQDNIGAYTWCMCPGTSPAPTYPQPTALNICPVTVASGVTTGDGHWVFAGGCDKVGPPGFAGEFHGDTRLVGYCCGDNFLSRSSSMVSMSYSHSSIAPCSSQIPLPGFHWKVKGNTNTAFESHTAPSLGPDRCLEACSTSNCSTWVWCPCAMSLSCSQTFPACDWEPCSRVPTRAGGPGEWRQISGMANLGPPPVAGRFYGEVALLHECACGSTPQPLMFVPPLRLRKPTTNAPRPYIKRERIQLLHGCAPGDIVCMTSLPRDIMLADPHRYEIHVATHCPELWANNPYIASYQHHAIPDARPIQLNYGSPMIYINNVKLHFITAFHRNFEELEQMGVPCRYPKGDLYLSAKEEQERPFAERYWVIFTGGKNDFTTKLWSRARWQQLVDALNARGIRVVQCGAVSPLHINAPMQNTINLIGKTNLRDVLQLIHHADGVICPITFPMHVAAALEKPCVVIAGGREHWWWEAYINSDVKTFGPDAAPVKVPHKFLHTQDLLPCCDNRGCWKNKIDAGTDKSVCYAPIDDDYGQIIPTCLGMISVEQVLDAVESYYGDGTIPKL